MRKKKPQVTVEKMRDGFLMARSIEGGGFIPIAILDYYPEYLVDAYLK